MNLFPIQRDIVDWGGGGRSKKQIINDILSDIDKLNDEEKLEFFEKFQQEYKVEIRKEKLKKIK
jgi:hypothetical protein